MCCHLRSYGLDWPFCFVSIKIVRQIHCAAQHSNHLINDKICFITLIFFSLLFVAALFAFASHDRFFAITLNGKCVRNSGWRTSSHLPNGFRMNAQKDMAQMKQRREKKMKGKQNALSPSFLIQNTERATFREHTTILLRLFHVISNQ